jgi:SAM-dependent methyltransferase
MVQLSDLLEKGRNSLGRRDDRDDGSSTVFIASTKEAMDGAWLVNALDLVENRVKDKVSLEPWTSAFKSGDITGEGLIARAKSIGAAVVVLTGDDETKSRGEGQPSPRDNLIFEAGIFISQLGFGRVLLLGEEGAKLPSDLLGVTLKMFDGANENGEMTDVKTRALALAISEFIERAVEETELVEDTGATRAAKTTLERSEAEIEEVRDVIARRSRPVNGVKLPDPTNAYLDGVKEVKESFFTTTYLDSKFWTMKEIGAVKANQYLMTRLAEGGSAKRLILLTRSIDAELRFQRDQRRLLRSGAPESVELMDREFAAFYGDNAKLVEKGFEVKVVFDQDEAHDQLPGPMNFRSGEDELALFDDERIDIYSGFTKKRAFPSARMFTDANREFTEIQAMTCDYFNSLWDNDRAVNFLDFGALLNGIIEDCKYEIDYEPNWLLRYDQDADDGDARLKEDELQYVLEVLGMGTREEIRHLDLGTCTGRYIRELREKCRVTLSVGIDLDPDCLRHCRGTLTGLPGSDGPQIIEADIRQADALPSGPFDVITCMMGTLCHLRRLPAEEGKFEDHWQTGLENLASRLADGGDAFVGIWNVDTLENGRMGSLLSIYPDRTNRILLELSPPIGEFQQRLEQAALRPVSHKLVRQCLHVFHLQNA